MLEGNTKEPTMVALSPFSKLPAEIRDIILCSRGGEACTLAINTLALDPQLPS